MKNIKNKLMIPAMLLMGWLMIYVNQPETAYAAAFNVEATDEQGLPVLFNDNNFALNAGAVTFKVDTSALKAGESIVYDDGSLISELPDGRYYMEAGEEGSIGFVNFYINGRDGMKAISDEPFFVEFTDKISTAPNVTYIKDEVNGAVTIETGVRAWVNTFMEINDGEKTVKKHITGNTRAELGDDGVYRVSIYTMDGRGNRTYSKKVPQVITIDRTPPMMTDIDIDKDMPANGPLISNKPVTVTLSAYDEISGLEGIYVQPGGNESVKADKITINAPFKGDISFWAKDIAGNESEKLKLGREIIVDDTVPVISAKEKDFKNGILTLLLSADDDLSGMEKLSAVLDGKTVFTGDGGEGELVIDLKNMEYGKKDMTVTASDRAGNTSEAVITLEKGDTVAPEITFLGAADRMVTGTDADVYINVTDDSGKIAAYSANVFVKDADGKMIYSQTTDSKSLHITQSGIVTVRVTAADYDGNSAEKELSFIIDKDAPFISGIEQYDGQVFEDFSLKDDVQDMIDDLSYVTYDIYLNGLQYDGKKVSREGKYVLKVTARDEFGNVSEKKADFTIKNEKKEEVAVEPVKNYSAKKPEKIVESISKNEPVNTELQTVSEPEVPEEAKPSMSLFQWIRYVIMNLFKK